MRVGDLVEYVDHPEESQGRTCGIVTRIDKYTPRGNHYSTEPIVEVIWNTGLSWILQSRVRLVNETG